MDRRILIILSLLILLTVIGFLVFVSNRSTNSTGRSQTSALDQIIATSARYPVVFGTTLYYFNTDTNEMVLYDLQTSSITRRLQFIASSDTNFNWSPSGLSVLASDSLTTKIVSLTDGTSALLSNNIHLPTWNYRGDQIFYQFLRKDPTKNTLAIADPDGTDFTAILDHPTRFEAFWWGKQDQYAIALDSSNTPSQYVRILLSSKRIQPLTSGYGGLRFSPDGSLAIIDLIDNQLGLVNIASGEVKTIANTTSTASTVWESDLNLLSYSANQEFVRISIPEGKLNTVTATKGLLLTNEVILAVSNKSLLLYDGNQIRSLTIKNP